jgi:four helix bundle protein
MYTYNFEKLEVWQLTRELTKEIYLITQKIPVAEKFGLSSQVRRAGVSVCSNIAEGTSRKTKKEKAWFMRVAYGSALEILNQFILSKDLNYISENEYINIRTKIEEVTNKLNALHNSLL